MVVSQFSEEKERRRRVGVSQLSEKRVWDRDMGGNIKNERRDMEGNIKSVAKGGIWKEI